MHESSVSKHRRITDEERTRCEIWTRVMGYHRPIAAFNPGKQAEHSERRCFEEGRARSVLDTTHHRPGLAESGEISGNQARRERCELLAKGR